MEDVLTVSKTSTSKEIIIIFNLAKIFSHIKISVALEPAFVIFT
jgi:hypothetical protein